MNYLAEIVAFESWLENGGYLAYGVQTVWYRLMWLNNKCGWQEWFQVDNQRLMVATQIRNEKTLIRYRDRLIEAGLLEYRKGKKGSPNQYRIIPLSENTVNNTVETTVKTTVKEGVKTTVEVSDIYKYKLKHKNNNNNNRARDEEIPTELRDPDFAAVNTAMVSATGGAINNPTHARQCLDWIETMGVDMVIYAVEKGAESCPGRCGWPYINGTLKAWYREGLISRELFDAHEKRRNSTKKATSVKPEDRFSHLLVDEGSEEE